MIIYAETNYQSFPLFKMILFFQKLLFKPFISLLQNFSDFGHLFYLLINFLLLLLDHQSEGPEERVILQEVGEPIYLMGSVPMHLKLFPVQKVE
jgi:hypothetical protein